MHDFVDFFRTCTRNSSPLVTSLEQKHRPSIANALVSQDVGRHFTGGSHRLANLYIQQLGPLCLWYSGNSDHGYAKSPKLSKFQIFHSLGLWLLLWRSLNFPSLHCSSVATSDMIICGQGFRSEIYWNFNYSPRKLLRMSNACSYVIVGRGCFSANTQFTPAFLYTHAELQFLKSLASPRVCRTSAEANTRHTLPPCLSKTTMILSHASDLSKLTTAMCNGYYQAASRCCSMSSGLEKGQKHGWKPFFLLIAYTSTKPLQSWNVRFPSFSCVTRLFG